MKWFRRKPAQRARALELVVDFSAYCDGYCHEQKPFGFVPHMGCPRHAPDDDAPAPSEPTLQEKIDAWNAYWVAEGEWRERRAEGYDEPRPEKPPKPPIRKSQTPQSPEDIDAATLARMVSHRAEQTRLRAEAAPYKYWVDGLEVSEQDDPLVAEMVADYERRYGPPVRLGREATEEPEPVKKKAKKAKKT